MIVNKKGFTLIEILVVIGILAILMGAVIVALNPGRQFAQARNSQRWAHIDAVLNAVYFNMADNNGAWVCTTGALPTSTTVMGSGVGEYDICSCLVPTYLAAMPADPSAGSYTDCSTYLTGYSIAQDTVSYRVTVAAPFAELGELISLSR